MSSESSKGVWAVVGKIATVLGVIIAILTIVKYFSVDGPVLKAQGGLYPLYFPTEAFEKSSLKRSDIERIIPKDIPDRESIVNDILSQTDDSNWRLRRSVTPLLDPDEGVIVTNITNVGNKDAQDLKLSIPAGGEYELRRVGEPIKFGTFEQVIALGNLQPGNTISLTAWPRFFSRSQTDSVRVTHSGGVADVEFAIPVNGVTALPHRYWGLTWLIGFLSVCGIFVYGVVLIARYLGRRSLPPKQESSTKDSTTGDVVANPAPAKQTQEAP